MFYYEPLKRGLCGAQERSPTGIAKGVSGLLDYPRSWWKEFRQTLRSDGWQSPRLDPAFFCLRESSSVHGMLVFCVDDMLLASDEGQNVEERI